jgi:predicted phage terminase large subunit-like protein
MWDVVEPGIKFKECKHIEAICQHLEHVTFGPGHPKFKESQKFIRNLLINIPPGHAKSLVICVFWPTWVWIEWPESKWIFASYSDDLATRDSVKRRLILNSTKYRGAFRIQWFLADDQNLKTRFLNNRMGFMLATSVGGTGTGERADFIVCDDPLNALQAESEVFRERADFWWNKTMSTRDSDPKTSRRVVVMQRLHEKDLAGIIIKQGDYEHLCLPAEFDPARKCSTSIGWSDWRTKSGELLWPEQFGPEQIKTSKAKLGSRGYAGQFQQNPLPADGGLFKRSWWKYFRERPIDSTAIKIQVWDTAQEVGISNDYSVCATWLKTETGLYCLDVWREKVESPQLYQAALSLFAKHNPSAVIVEKKNSGAALIQYLKQNSTLPVIPYEPKLSKEVRASAATPTVEAGNCYLPQGANWVEYFISEHEKFPLGEHDDQVDTTSMMVDYFSNKKIQPPRVRSL